jgi:hypothetical protein
MRPLIGNQMPIGGFPIGGFPKIGGPAIQPPSNNSNGLASTVNSLPPQIESLSSALQNINELANQLTGGIGALMGSLQGNENAPTLGNQMPMRPPIATINHMGMLRESFQPAIGGGILGLQQGGTRIPMFNPLQQAGGQM